MAEGQPLSNGARTIIHPLTNKLPQPAPYTQYKINPQWIIDLSEKHKNFNVQGKSSLIPKAQSVGEHIDETSSA